jgi:hypothetical protein
MIKSIREAVVVVIATMLLVAVHQKMHLQMILQKIN